MAQRQFTFINRTGGTKQIDQNEDDIPIIRSHAMREVRRRRHLKLNSQSRRKVATHPSTITDDNDGCSLYAITSLSSVVDNKRTLSTFPLGTAIGTTGISLENLQHLQYFMQGFKSLTFPISYIRHSCDILRVALSQRSPAVLHALCAVSTLHQAVIRNHGIGMATVPVLKADQRTIGRVFLYHKQRAIVSLQMSLSSSSSLRDPSSMATVALLLLIESLSGDTATSNTHRRGFVELVDRYGMPHKEVDLMSSDVLMADIKSATTSLLRPSMRICNIWMTDLNQLGREMFVPRRTELLYLGSGFMTGQVSDHLDPALLELLRGMRNVINAVEQNFDMGIDASGVGGTYVLALEHRLLSISCNETDEHQSNSKMSECCRLACLLYCNLCLWTWQKNTTLVRNLVSYLHAAMLLWTPKECDEQYSVLLWFYFVASIAASSTEDYQWSITGMRNASKWLDLLTEDDLRSVLSGFFFVDRLMAKHLADCYDEIKLARP